MELSILCGVKVYMFIYDQNQTRMSHYQSSIEDSLQILLKKNIQKEYYTNQDYERLVSKKDKDNSCEEESTIIKPNEEYAEIIEKDIDITMIGKRNMFHSGMKEHVAANPPSSSKKHFHQNYQSYDLQDSDLHDDPKPHNYANTEEDMTMKLEKIGLTDSKKKIFKKELQIDIPKHNKILQAQMVLRKSGQKEEQQFNVEREAIAQKDLNIVKKKLFDNDYKEPFPKIFNVQHNQEWKPANQQQQQPTHNQSGDNNLQNQQMSQQEQLSKIDNQLIDQLISPQQLQTPYKQFPTGKDGDFMQSPNPGVINFNTNSIIMPGNSYYQIVNQFPQQQTLQQLQSSVFQNLLPPWIQPIISPLQIIETLSSRERRLTQQAQIQGLQHVQSLGDLSFQQSPGFHHMHSGYQMTSPLPYQTHRNSDVYDLQLNMQESRKSVDDNVKLQMERESQMKFVKLEEGNKKNKKAKTSRKEQ